MKNIYDMFNNRQEEILDIEFQQLQEGYDECLILEKEIYTHTLEYLVYNNPEKKRLSVLIEEAEANSVQKTNDIISKLREQMKKVLEWITNVFNFHQKAIDEGVKFIKSVDLNQCVLKIRRKGDIPTINYHPRKAPFERIRTKCTKRIDEALTQVKRHSGSRLGLSSYDDIMENDREEDRLENNLKEFKLDKENLEEIKLDTVNVIGITNTIISLPAANKYLHNAKGKIQDAYNKAMNAIRNAHVGDTSARHENKGNRELKRVNQWMKIANERIRAYSKLMTIVFKEEYSTAKKLVAAANGENANKDNKEENK